MNTRFACRPVIGVLTVLVLIASVRVAPAAEPLDIRELWLYCPGNLLVDENIDRLEGIWRRAAAAGYTHVLLGDSKFCRLHEMPERYFANVDRLKRLAGELRLEIVPAVFPIGWSNDILSQDPNLAEGLPVRDALFIVQDGEARLAADPPVELRGGDFADLVRWDWKDDTVTPDDGAARISDPRDRNCRIVQNVKVSPFRQYRLSVRIKTQDFQGTPEVKVLADGQALNFENLGVQPTQDWTTYHCVFNSLEHEEVGIYLGCWGGGDGTAWYDDATIEEVGLLNVLRRPGAPVVVRLEERGNAGRTLVEGKDYEPIADPHLGNDPWQGEYKVSHDPPVIKTNLPDGTRLRVSYYHPMIIYGGSVMIALSEPRTLELLRDHAERVHQAFGARRYFMGHDEIRVLNWDAASQERKLDAGPLLAQNVRDCRAILRDIAPNARVYVWSDMFDPHHNAHKDYYLVRGDLAGSWEGLDPDTTVAVWGYDTRNESLKWFAGRGHKQLIAGYYDSPPENVRGWLDAARESGNVEAVMYTTWRNNYADIEAFARIVKDYPRLESNQQPTD
jgi:hypothetical protein